METQSVPLRNYLMTHVMPTLTKGLIECCKQKPEDPIDYLVKTFYDCFGFKAELIFFYDFLI